jgi:hypothetical protein
MMIEKDLLSRLIHGERHAAPGVWEWLATEAVGTWRWGTIYQIALRHVDTEKMYGYEYRQQDGDEHYNSIEHESDDVELFPVKTKTVIVYRRVG